eukprot:jgi/Astpho2/2010/e_gw1.00038.127.1_t
MSEAASQIAVNFVTKLPPQLRVPAASVTVPSDLTRLGLSQVVNGLLNLDHARPFDFLLNGELVRQPLEEMLLGQGLSTERVLELEYFRAVAPPTPDTSLPHDDWVSAVEGNSGAGTLTGSYDGILRCWQGAVITSCSPVAHHGGVTALRALPGSQGSLAVSAGKDLQLALWHLPKAVGAAVSKGAMDRPQANAWQQLASYAGHKAAVECVAPSPDGARITSGGWDSNLFVWPTGLAAEPAALSMPKKKRKASDMSAQAASPTVHAEAPQQQLAGHTQCVAGVAWPETQTVISGSWDHSVRSWDVETGVQRDALNSSKAVYAVDTAPGTASVVALAGADKAWRLWDSFLSPMPCAALQGLTAYASHKDWITGIAWCPTSATHLATVSHDKTCKLWDTRSIIPLHTLEGHTDKVFCVSWTADGEVITGGADCIVRKFQVHLNS